MARPNALTTGLLSVALAVAIDAAPVRAQSSDTTVTVPAASEPVPNVSSGASKVIIPVPSNAGATSAGDAAEKVNSGSEVKPVEAASEPAKKVEKKATSEKPQKKPKPEAADVVTNTAPAGDSEVLPWAAPPPPASAAADKPAKDKVAKEKDKKAADAAKAAVKCEEQTEDGCRSTPKCAWVADIAQADGSRIAARCAEKTVFAPPGKKKTVTNKPKPQPVPDAKPDQAGAPGTPAKPDEKPAEKAAEKSADTANSSGPVTVSPPVEAVVKVPVEKAAETAPAVVDPVKPQ